MSRKSIIFSTLALGLAIATPALAQNVTTKHTSAAAVTANSSIACVGAAVATRESALDAGIATHWQAVSGAYTARAAALQQAYAKTTSADVKSGIKAAWSAFTSSTKNASKAWKATKTAAWSNFAKSSKSCKDTASVSDSANSTSETTGQ